MKKYTRILLIIVTLISLACLISSCDIIPQDIFGRKIPEHNCEDYSRWEVVTYPTELIGGVKRNICDYCGKMSDLGVIPDISKDLQYEIREDEVWITGIGDCTDTELVIPEKIEDKNVIGIADKAFAENANIKSVIMPDTVRSVGYGAFYGTSSLTDVILSSRLEYLGALSFGESALTSMYVPGNSGFMSEYGVFSKCESLERVILGEGIERIESEAFRSCAALEFISLPSTLKSIRNAFYGAENLKTVNFRGDIGQYCELDRTDNSLGGNQSYYIFYGADVLVSGESIPENLVIPEGTTKIADRAFWCMDIKSVKIPDSVTDIGNEAFFCCVNLETVELGRGLKSIGYYAFRDCEKIKEIKIYDGIEAIGHGAFQECRGLEYVEIGEGLEVLKQSVFECVLSLETVKFPSTLKRFEYPMFLFETKLQNVYYGGTAEEWIEFINSSPYSCDEFDGLTVHCSDGNVYDNKIVAQ